MYKDEETKVSYKYLGDVIKNLEEPICLLGGWAVYFLVNSNFKKEKGYPYLGSRDIDLGFNNINIMKRVIYNLESFGFKHLSFRFYKEVHSETMNELSTEEAKKTPLHFIFPMYVDLIFDKITPKLKSKLGFIPIDEPFLTNVFEGEKIESIVFGKKLIMPKPSLILAMKISSIFGRDKNHKRIKDLCDIVALCLYSGEEIGVLKSELDNLIKKEDKIMRLGIVNNDDIEYTAKLLNLDNNIIINLLNKLKN